MSHLPRPALGQSSHQLIQEFTLLLGSHLVAAAAHVQRVFPESLVAGAQIESQGQGGLGANTRAGSVQSQLTNGNTHAVDAKVTQTENPGTIGDTCDFHVRLGPVGNDSGQVAAILPAQVHT